MNKEIAYSASNRIGKFRVLHEILNDGREQPLLKALFGLGVVLHVEPCESGRGMVYVVASDLFQPISEGEEIPEYRIESAWPDQAFTNPDHEKDCLRRDGFRFRAVRKIIVRVPPASISHRSAVPGQTTH
jgi:hypothetical protein